MLFTNKPCAKSNSPCMITPEICMARNEMAPLAGAEQNGCKNTAFALVQLRATSMSFVRKQLRCRRQHAVIIFYACLTFNVLLDSSKQHSCFMLTRKDKYSQKPVQKGKCACHDFTQIAWKRCRTMSCIRCECMHGEPWPPVGAIL